MSEETREEQSTAPESADEEGRAVDAALNFLSYRPRTRAEVHRKLTSRGFSEEACEAALQRLGAVGLIDDAAFVGSYVRDRIAHRPMGVRRMAAELYLKGIPRDVALPVIEDVLREENIDERWLAERAAEKKHRALGRGGESVAADRRRLRDHLARRGFDARVVREIVDGLLPRE